MLILSCLFLSVGLIYSQTITVNGIVVDDAGIEVVGASVVVKGTTTGVATDVDGKFSLNVPSNSTLVFSLVGMKKKEMKATPSMNVVMESDTEILDEVIVVAYGTAKKASFTGAAKQVSSDQIASGSKESIDKALGGKIAGVRVTSNTGDPGSAGEIAIRGIGSIGGNRSPLYVVDGIPVESGDDASFGSKSSSLLSSFNPDEVESVTVLKDAAASSLYGSRAANGVILITTKKGTKGKTRVSYKGEEGWSKMAVKQFEMANAATLIDYTSEALANYYIGSPNYPNVITKADGYAQFQKEGDLPDFLSDPSGNTNTNWRDEVYRTGKQHNHQVSLSGGNDKTKLYANLGYNKVDGIVKGIGFERVSGRVNVDHELNNRVSVSLKQSLSGMNQKGPRDQSDQAQGIGTSSPLGILFAMDPTASVYNADGTINKDAGWGKVSNPKLMLGSSDEFIRSKTFRSITNGDLNVKILPQLVFNTSLAYDFINSQHHEFWGPGSVNGESIGGYGYRFDYTKRTFTTSSTLRYTESFGLHNIELLGGFESNLAKTQTLYGRVEKYSTGKLPELSSGQATNASSGRYKSSLLSYLGNATYNYDNRYYLGASFRTDGSSFLGADNRWASFYSGSLAWRLTQEDFFPKMPLINDLKLRASVGTNGNLPTTYYKNQSLYAFNGAYGESSAIYWSQIGNSKLGWEKSMAFNIGLDWNIYDRVSLSVEYFNKTTKDQLLNLPVSYVTGFSEVLSNLGKIRNTGFEIEINTQNIINKDFTWITNFNLATLKNKVISLPEGSDINYGDGDMYMIREGESLFSFNLPVWKGVDPATGLGMFMVDPNDSSKGLTPYYTEAGKAIVGKPQPDVTGGITNTFTYKDFDLSILISYQFGGDLFDYPGYFSRTDGVRLGTFNIPKDMEGNYWKNPGDVVDNPKPIINNSYRSDRWSTRHILSTDNIRLRELNVGYNLPVKKVGIDKVVHSLRLYFSANNPMMIWAKEKNIDPDVSLLGYRQVDTPVTKSFIFGLNVEF